MTAPLLCIDCRHYRPATTSERFARCASPMHGLDLVLGGPILRTCESQRSSSSRIACGPSGVFFVAKVCANAFTLDGME